MDLWGYAGPLHMLYYVLYVLKVGKLVPISEVAGGVFRSRFCTLALVIVRWERILSSPLHHLLLLVQ